MGLKYWRGWAGLVLTGWMLAGCSSANYLVGAHAVGLSSEYQQAANLRYQNSQKELQRAASSEEEVLRRSPHSVKAYIRFSTILLALGQPQNALRAARRAVALNSKDLSAQLNLGNLLLALGQLQPADEAFSQALKTAPDSWRAWDGKAQIATDQHLYGTSSQDLQKALEAGGPEALTFDQWGRLDAAQNRWQRSLTYFQNAEAVDTSWWQADYDAARALMHLGQLQPAAADLQRALTLSPGNAQAYWLLEEVEATLSAPTKAPAS